METKVKQSKITSFLLPKERQCIAASAVQKVIVHSQDQSVEVECIPSKISESSPSPYILRSDVAYFITSRTSNQVYSKDEQIQILSLKLEVDDDYKFPFTQIGGVQRSFQKVWIQKYPWVLYSVALDKVFCKECVARGISLVGKGSHEVSGLIIGGFSRWNNALEKFKIHNSCSYHVQACTDNEGFVSVLANKRIAIASQLNSQRIVEAKRNRNILGHIIESIVFCGRQGIPLRGHRESDSSSGNFQALLKYRIQSGDEVLKAHMLQSPKNALYTSPEIQNELITICGDYVLSKIVDRVNSAKCFSVLADETTDIFTVEQLSVCVRYYDELENKMREDFLTYVPVADLTGDALAKTILSTLTDLGINLKYLRGQGYDGAANMSGVFKGVQTRIKQCHPTALYTHCSNHKLNLGIGAACSISEVQMTFAVVSKAIKFFSKSTKRYNILTKNVKHSSIPKRCNKRLVKMCETRWVERHDCILRFVELLPVIVETLQEIHNMPNSDAKTKLKSKNLLSNIKSSSFLVGLLCSKEFLSLTLPLSKNLQSKDLDLISCLEMVKQTISVMNTLRQTADTEFCKIFNEVEKICDDLGIEVKLPRKVSRQQFRPNYPTNNPEAFYRQSIYIPILDHFMAELNSRFDHTDENIELLVMLLPSKVQTVADSHYFDKMLKFYAKDVSGQEELFDGEFRRWKDKWAKHALVPKNAIESLVACNNVCFPIIYKLLKILCTIPVTTATAERSFSTLKRLKSYLRSTMVQDRLNGLAVLHIYKEVEIVIEDIIQAFALKKARALNFVL